MGTLAIVLSTAKNWQKSLTCGNMKGEDSKKYKDLVDKYVTTYEKRFG